MSYFGDPKYDLPDTKAKTSVGSVNCESYGLTGNELRYCREVINTNPDLRADLWQRGRIAENLNYYRNGSEVSTFVYNLEHPTSDENLQWWLDFASNNNSGNTMTEDSTPVKSKGVLHAYRYIKDRDPATAQRINEDFQRMPPARSDGSWMGPQKWLWFPLRKSSGHIVSGVKEIFDEAKRFSLYAPDATKTSNGYEDVVTGQTEESGAGEGTSAGSDLFANFGDDMESLVWAAGGIGVLVVGFWLAT